MLQQGTQFFRALVSLVLSSSCECGTWPRMPGGRKHAAYPTTSVARTTLWGNLHGCCSHAHKHSQHTRTHARTQTRKQDNTARVVCLRLLYHECRHLTWYVCKLRSSYHSPSPSLSLSLSLSLFLSLSLYPYRNTAVSLKIDR